MKTPLLNPVLTGLASRFIATQPTVGLRIAPVLNSQIHAAQYYVYDPANHYNVPTNIQRAPSSPFKRLKSSLSSDTFLCKDYGVEEPIDKMQLQMFSSIFAADRSGMDRAVNVVLLNHEIRVRDMARGVTQTSTPAVKWNAQANTTIVGDIEMAKAVIRAQIGVIPNMLTLPYDVFVALRQAPELRAYYQNTDGLVTIEQMKVLFGVEEIVVSGAIINGANEGQAASLADIWTDEAFLSYSKPSPDVKALNFARTFNWTAADGSGPAGVSTFTYDENEIDSRVVRARQFTDEKVIAAGAGYYFSNVLN
ncbi:hypothetical protein OKA04_12880 [Luteolibacter flavescens]|uniref:Capsid protein n=1 Tax=Luteolibacter flavescens TaxID=1859460 RepID=A0ABT3FPW9_9BACT|nr:hypothetical protein [Luteolibacter flavescens]MCW1885626.1 hypothetical protein [Luteolibacter flavescens]